MTMSDKKQERGKALDKDARDRKRPPADQPKSSSGDQPGAAGQSTAGAEEDTYD